MTSKRPFQRALPHGALDEILPNIFFVTGTIAMPGPLPIRFSRNMVVVREGERLVLINSVRLDEAGLAALDRLGKVTDVIRLAANHGIDDPFYQDRYKAKIWALRGQRYTAGFDTSKTETYFKADVEIETTTELPLNGARIHFIHATPSEGLLLLPQHGGVLVAGDALQHWATTDAYFSWMGRAMMKKMGFIKPHNVGPAWLKQCKPPRDDMRAILDLPFTNVLPSHGAPVIGDAVANYRPAIDRCFPPA
jgi:hypothetical protein